MANPSQQLMTSLGAPPIGAHLYNTVGTHSWLCPAGVSLVSVVCIGGGAAGKHGGGLGWRNNIAVVAGTSYSVVVGAGGPQVQGTGTTSYGSDSSVLSTIGEGATSAGGGYTGDGGGSGGLGQDVLGSGGAGGYSGNGGDGNNYHGTGVAYGGDGTGGAGGAGGAGAATTWWGGGGGGGTGLYGQGSNGTGGLTSSIGYPTGGGGGSSGTNGGQTTAGLYGGGGASQGASGTTVRYAGGAGGVRILWGYGRAFPSTDVTQDYAGETEGLN